MAFLGSLAIAHLDRQTYWPANRHTSGPGHNHSWSCFEHHGGFVACGYPPDYLRFLAHPARLILGLEQIAQPFGC